MSSIDLFVSCVFCFSKSASRKCNICSKVGGSSLNFLHTIIHKYMRWDSIEFARSYRRLLRMEKDLQLPREHGCATVIYMSDSILDTFCQEVPSYRIQTHRAAFQYASLYKVLRQGFIAVRTDPTNFLVAEEERSIERGPSSSHTPIIIPHSS